MTLPNNIFISSQRQENVANFCRFVHRHDPKTVKYSFDRLDRIDFGDNDVTAQAFGAHSAAFAAPAITGDDDIFPGNDEIRRPHDTVPRRLPRTVAVVEKILAVSVVGGNHWKFKFSFCRQRMQTMNAGRRLLRAAQYSR